MANQAGEVVRQGIVNIVTVKFDNGLAASGAWRNLRPEVVTEQFKRGDMVEIVSHKEVEGSYAESYREYLPMHTPLEVCDGNDDDNDVAVYVPEKPGWYYVPAANLRRVSNAEQPTAPLTEVIINGVRYVPAPAEAEAKGERRIPGRGEIWRDEEGDLLLVTDVDDAETGCPAGVYLTRIHVGELGFVDIECGDTYAYPSLAAAIEAGEKF